MSTENKSKQKQEAEPDVTHKSKVGLVDEWGGYGHSGHSHSWHGSRNKP